MRLRTILCLAALVLASACSSGSSTPSDAGTGTIPADCLRPVSSSALTGTQVQALGTHTAGDNVAFNVPAGTASFTIMQQAKTANLNVTYKGQVIDNSAVPGVILKPDGTRAYDDNDSAFSSPSSADGGQDPSGIYGFYGGGSPSTAAFTIPNTSYSLDAGVPPGTWHFTVNDYAYECQTGTPCSDGGTTGNTYDVIVVSKAAPPAKPTLDLAFYIIADVTNPSTGQKLTAASSATDPSVQRMVSTITTLYGDAGITISTPVFYDVAPAAVTRFGTHINADTTGPCDELDQMFTLSADHPGNVLNLFLVQSITSKNSGGGSVVGIDGTIPGPASLSGTVHSGAAVSLADLFAGPGNCISGPDISCGADLTAFIAAHEAGHFLGLFHTTESDGRDFDPITDTPKCPCLNCAASTDQANCSTGGTAAHPIFLKATQCPVSRPGCGGGNNLMFWQLEAPVSAGVISPQQAAVMALSPVVH